jgi:hypothetical protein
MDAGKPRREQLNRMRSRPFATFVSALAARPTAKGGRPTERVDLEPFLADWALRAFATPRL